METLGKKLSAAREKKRLNLSRAAALTRIKIQHLEMMENDDFSKMPAPTYAKGFIRIYAGILGLDPEPLVQEYIDRHLNATNKPETATARQPRVEPVSKPESSQEKSEPVLARLKSLIPGLRDSLRGIIPHLPRLAIALIVVFLLFGLVRCALRLGSGNGNHESGPARLNEQAIMKEPPVRYLELPPPENAKP